MGKVLVTGATGFIGSHLVEMLVDKGYEVVAFDRYNPTNNWGWLENSKYKKDFEIYLGDIRDYDSVYKSITGCNSVFHLAALVGIPYSYISPKAYIETNITGTYNILQASKEVGLNEILITSTSETYGTAQYVPIDEKHPIIGQSPYSASKIAADQLSISFYKSFGMPIKIVRPFNTYGPRQSARAIIPSVISQILNGKKSIKLGNLKPTRDLTYVKDTCSGFYELFKAKDNYGEIINIGMNQEISISELVNKIASLMNVEINVQHDNKRVRPNASEVERLICDNSKILAKTNWKPLYNLETGLLETVNWLKRNIDTYKPEIYNV